MMVAATNHLYLSRLLLNPHSRRVMAEMAHPYEMHRTFMRAFPEAADETKRKARDEFGVLFRAEVDEPRGLVKVYVQSSIEPKWSFLDELEAYLCTDAGMPRYEHKDIMPALCKVRAGQVLSFRLRANPTARVAKQGDPMKGKRVALAREDEQIEWLIRKGQAGTEGAPGAFELLMKKVEDGSGEARLIPCVRVCPEGKKAGRKREAARGHATTHASVLFDGLLRVTDTDAFLGTLARGIGPAKAFGFGLLSVAPVQSSACEGAT
jgi:CRISPR system Cascade subunit CasE